MESWQKAIQKHFGPTLGLCWDQLAEYMGEGAASPLSTVLTQQSLRQRVKMWGKPQWKDYWCGFTQIHTQDRYSGLQLLFLTAWEERVQFSLLDKGGEKKVFIAVLPIRASRNNARPMGSGIRHCLNGQRTDVSSGGKGKLRICLIWWH